MSYGVEDDSELEAIDPNRTTKNFGNFGMKFVDISNTEGLKRREWSQTAPEWRRCRHGLCLEGICTNSACKARGQVVIIPMGYKEFDVVRDANSSTTVCPICKTYVEPENCGFNNCWWRFDGVKQEGPGISPKQYSSNWEQADDAFHYFDKEMSGMATWRKLEFKVVKNKPVQ
ncbi:unnamed protein product [Rotaria sordida]|uniref:Uncharacterized protein n=1 Tax=Rotaria sordida TaxID=392033 RepID=A0A815LQV3_9BILA|nr:unnamed protein product [Rotaria sordida]CAF4018746.1 unnamed protein product [Rotaria sordida]